MLEENMNQEFRLKKIDESINYLIEETSWNKLRSKKHKKGCSVFNYIEHLLTAISIITGSISISDFAPLVGIPVRITSTTMGLKIWAITTGIKKYTSIIKKKKNKHNRIGLLAKSKLNSIEVLISKALIDSNISHDQLVLINNVLKEFMTLKKK